MSSEGQPIQTNPKRSAPNSKPGEGLPEAIGSLGVAVQELRVAATRGLPPRLSFLVEYDDTTKDATVYLLDAKTKKRAKLALTWE